MIKYRKVSSWKFGRNFTKSPQQSLLDLEMTQAEAIYVKRLKGQSFLLCHFDQLAELNLISHFQNQSLGVTTQAQDSFQLTNSTFTFGLSDWLSTLQRFLAVALTQQIETQTQSVIDIGQMIKQPIEWSLFHLGLQCDLRKANRSRDLQILNLIKLFKQGLNSPYTRLFPSVHGFNSWRLSQRRLSKLLSQVPSQGPMLAVNDVYAFTEWQQHLAESIIWSLLLLEQDSKTMQELKTEVNEALAQQAYQTDSLAKLPKLACFIYEVLRLFPPVWLSSWGKVSDLQNQSDLFQSIKQDLNPQTVLMSTALHSHFREIDWPSPFSFQPQRFLGIFYGAQAPQSFVPFGSGAQGKRQTQIAVHTIASVLSSILRRGRLNIEPSSWLPLQFPLQYGPNTVPEWIGTGFGIPPQLQGQFTLDESYIYIPSARI